MSQVVRAVVCCSGSHHVTHITPHQPHHISHTTPTRPHQPHHISHTTSATPHQPHHITLDHTTPHQLHQTSPYIPHPINHNTARTSVQILLSNSHFSLVSHLSDVVHTLTQHILPPNSLQSPFQHVSGGLLAVSFHPRVQHHQRLFRQVGVI